MQGKGGGMIARRKIFGQAHANTAGTDVPARPCWVTPGVHTLLDMALLPAETDAAGQDSRNVSREWDLHGFGILMTADGVLHALDPVAYRTWQLHKEYDAVEDVANVLATEWDVEVTKALQDAINVLSRLREVDAAASA
jgi:hypothetical protein